MGVVARLIGTIPEIQTNFAYHVLHTVLATRMGNCCRTYCQKCCSITPDKERDDGNQAFLGKDLPEVSGPTTSSAYRALHNRQSPPPSSPSHFSDESTSHAGDSFPKDRQEEEQTKQETSTDSGHESIPDIIDTDTNASSPQVKFHVEDEISERVLTPLLPAEPEGDTSEKAKLLGDEETSGSGDTEEQGFSVDIVMLGSVKVGKSCLIERMIRGETYNFEDDKDPTVGMKVFKCEVHVPLSVTKNYSAPLLTVSLWDIPGQITSASTLKTSLRNKDAVCLVYDRTSLSSAEELVKRTPDIFKYAPGRAHFVFLANKADDFPHPELNSVADSISKITQKRGIKEYEVSAKTGYNVSDVFFNLVYDTACKKFTERKLREVEAEETEV